MAETNTVFRTKSMQAMLETTQKQGLKRVLGPIELMALGIGAVIGTGIFVLTGVAAAEYAGPALIISFIISGFVCVCAYTDTHKVATRYGRIQTMGGELPCHKRNYLLMMLWPWYLVV